MQARDIPRLRPCLLPTRMFVVFAGMLASYRLPVMSCNLHQPRIKGGTPSLTAVHLFSTHARCKTTSYASSVKSSPFRSKQAKARASSIATHSCASSASSYMQSRRDQSRTIPNLICLNDSRRIASKIWAKCFQVGRKTAFHTR